jgi:hypothetical protein
MAEFNLIRFGLFVCVGCLVGIRNLAIAALALVL